MPRTFAVPAPLRMRLIVAIGAALLISAAVTLVQPAVGARAANASVSIQDSAFGPGTVTVTVGETVTWTNADSDPHTVTAQDGSFDSGNLDPGQVFSFTFTAPGTYAYVCNYHSDMQATVVVLAAESQPAAQPAAPGGTTNPQVPAATVAPATNAPVASHGAGHQPDTALPIESQAQWPVAQVLIGLGIVAFAFGVVPVIPGRWKTSTMPAAPAVRMDGGWRR